MNRRMISSGDRSITGTSAFPISTLTTRTPLSTRQSRSSSGVAATLTSFPAPLAIRARSALLQVQVGWHPVEP